MSWGGSRRAFRLGCLSRVDGGGVVLCMCGPGGRGRAFEGEHVRMWADVCL